MQCITQMRRYYFLNKLTVQNLIPNLKPEIISKLNRCTTYTIKTNQTNMNKLLILTLFYCASLFANNPVNETQKTQSLIHIWGLLKYYHPEVSKGTFDFNQEFLTEFDKLASITTQEELNTELINWVKKFDLGKAKFKSNEKFLKTKNLFTKNADFTWIETSGFNPELIENLTTIKDNGNRGDYYANFATLTKQLKFGNEKGLANFDATIKSHRVLFLSSFWNIIRYWDVNIYLADQNWNDALTEMIPEFTSESNITYQLAKEKLITKLNDSHSDYVYDYTLNKTISKYPVFGGRVVNDSLVITSIRNKSLITKDNLELGDVVFSADGKILKKYISDKFFKTISASNPSSINSRIEKFLILGGTKDSITVGILKKDGAIHNQYIDLYQGANNNTIYMPSSILKTGNYYNLKSNIGYLNLAKVNNKDLKKAFTEFKDAKGIIIDLRNYPGDIGDALGKYLYPKKTQFVKALAPIAPGYSEYDIKAPLKILKDIFKAGSNNKNYYKGTVILLVDRKTASHGEHVAMLIQQSPNCITIGEQTFGAIFNRKGVTLADKTTVDFTDAGAFYPNDIGVQRNGIKLDHVITESAKNYDPDLYIKEAIKLIEAN